MAFSLEFSPMESERFSIRAGKLKIDDINDVVKVIPQMSEMGLNFLSTRIPTENMDLTQKLLKLGFILTDTLVVYKGKLSADLHQNPKYKNLVREATPDDYEQIIAVAKNCFTNYMGHYHSDPKFDKKLADEVYIDWARRSCLESFLTDVLLVTEEGGRISSFITLKKTDDISQALLGGVDPSYQNKGIYRDLIRATKQWSLKLNCKDIIYSTQVSNVAVQKVWVQEGSQMFESFYTLHFWHQK